MFNPLVNDLQNLTDSQLEEKVYELQRKYFQTHNPGLQQQISNLLEMFKQELYTRRAIAAQKLKDQLKEDGKGLDSLINIS